MTRQSTSKSILGVDWDYPVAGTFAEDLSTGKHTVVRKSRVALPRIDAFKKIAGDDQRPLLVMRECTKCKGTEHAIFTRRLNNEKTQLLLQWFHCVKLPPDVMKKNHPFHSLFASRSAYVPHLFVATADGKNRLNFSGSQPQTVLQKELVKLIGLSYEKKPKPAITAMLRYLSKFDMLDMSGSGLLERIDRAREKSGPRSSLVRKLQKKLAKIRKDKDQAMKMAKAVCDLKLKVTDKKAD